MESSGSQGLSEQDSSSQSLTLPANVAAANSHASPGEADSWCSLPTRSVSALQDCSSSQNRPTLSAILREVAAWFEENPDSAESAAGLGEYDETSFDDAAVIMKLQSDPLIRLLRGVDTSTELSDWGLVAPPPHDARFGHSPFGESSTSGEPSKSREAQAVPECESRTRPIGSILMEVADWFDEAPDSADSIDYSTLGCYQEGSFNDAAVFARLHSDFLVRCLRSRSSGSRSAGSRSAPLTRTHSSNAEARPSVPKGHTGTLARSSSSSSSSDKSREGASGGETHHRPIVKWVASMLRAAERRLDEEDFDDKYPQPSSSAATYNSEEARPGLSSCIAPFPASLLVAPCPSPCPNTVRVADH